MSNPNEIEQGTPAQSIFFRELHTMLNIESHNGSTAWLPDGGGFVILHKQEFSDRVLPAYFGQAKYTSFTRRLKRWGFKRTNTGAYYHEMFQRGMSFDLDLDGAYPTDINSPTIPSKTLPLKKRAKWMPSSPSPFEEQSISQHGSPSAQSDDVQKMPALMRTINRQKRMEKKEECHHAAAAPSRDMAYHEIPVNRSSTLERSVEAAETLASFGRQESPQYSDGSLIANRYSMEDFRPNPPLYNQNSNLDRALIDPDTKVRNMAQRYDYSHWNGSSTNSFPFLYQSNPPPGLCQLTCDSKRVPIHNPQQRQIQAFNRAA